MSGTADLEAILANLLQGQQPPAPPTDSYVLTSNLNSLLNTKADELALDQLSQDTTVKLNKKLDITGDISTTTIAVTNANSRLLPTLFKDRVNIKNYGAIGDGATHPLSSKFSTLTAAQTVYACAVALTDEIDWCAIQTAVNTGRPVYVPDGYYMVNRTINVTLNGVLLEGCHRDATQIRRHGDFGPTIKFNNPANCIYNTGLRDLNFYDFGGAPGLGAPMTQAKSPYQIVFDNHKGTKIETTYIALGPNSSSAGGGISLLGSVEFILEDVYITLDAGESTNRYALQIGVSKATNAISPGGTGKNSIHALNIEGSTFNYTNGVLTSINSHIDDGIRIESGDGLWISDTHVQGTTIADLHFATKSGVQLSNIHIINTMLDITNGSSFLADGTGVIERISFEGRLSAAGVGGAGGTGFLVTTNVTITEGCFTLGIQGFKGAGLDIQSANSNGLVFNISQITYCLGGGLLFEAGKNISVNGGVIGNDNVTSYGVQLGTGVNGFTANNITILYTAPSPAGYGYIFQNGASNICINGGRTLGNISGNLLDLTSSTAKIMVRGVLGVADISKNIT